MKRILSLLSLSGMLFADQAIVITFGKTQTNSQEQNSLEQISTDTLTYNKITAKSDYTTTNKTFCYTDGSGSQISARFVNKEYTNNISTDNEAITLADNIEQITRIFGVDTINGVLTSTDSNTLQIMLKGLDSGNYTLYAFAARGDTPTQKAPTYYFLSSVTDIKASVIAHANSYYEVLDSFGSTVTPTIEAHTYNDSSKITRWALMKFDFSVKDGTEQVIFNSASNGNIAAIALVEHSTPEPTTTTLGLLALTALAARRRRK